MNEYLQIHVMGKCWHSAESCNKCERCFGTGTLVEHPDFSDPTHYEALRKQLVKLGEWEEFMFWLEPKMISMYLDCWEERDLSDRIPLIHEYAISRGVEYWKEKRG